MPAIRFRSRHLHATVYNKVVTLLDAGGWTIPPINFGALPVTVMDYQPEERAAVAVTPNTVAVSLGDYQADEDEEIGARGGGLRSAMYVAYIDVYMAEQALSHAICDDIRDGFTDAAFPLVDQITGLDTASLIEIENIYGPERPPANQGAEQFKRHWRTMRLECRLYFQS